MSESESGEIDILAPEEEALRTLTVREEVLDLLLEKVAEDRYPSSDMMDDIEQLLTPWRREEYAEILLDKIRESRYPSRTLITRLLRLSS